MDRVTIKLDARVADRVRLAKVVVSADVGQQLTISQAIEYLIEHWMLTRGQRHRLTVGPDGRIVSPLDAAP